MTKYTQWTWRAARALVLGALLIGVNAVLIWTLEHTDIVAFAIVLLFSSLSVFALCRLLWPTLRSTHHIDDQDAPTGRSEAEQPQDQTGRLTRRRQLPDRFSSGRRLGTAVGVSLLEFQQLRHARLKFTNRRLAVVTADDRSRFEPMPDHARSPRLQGNGAAVAGSRGSCRQQGDNEKNGPTKACFERGNHFSTFKGQAAGRSANAVPAGQHSAFSRTRKLDHALIGFIPCRPINHR